jgi:hypothetical protein
MSFLIADRVKETSTSTGTGAFTLAGAMIGFQTFSSAIGNNNQTFYTITDGIDFEVGSGTYFSSGSVLNRDVVISSSNSNNPVNWGAGEKQVFVTYPASQAVFNFPPNVVLTGAVSATAALGSVNVPSEFEANILVVAGGGGGGRGGQNFGGGGGAGGYISQTSTLSTLTNYSVSVGAGGAGGPASSTGRGISGGDSTFPGLTAVGGGGGGAQGSSPGTGADGGSGGGGGYALAGGAGTPGQGFAGGSGNTGPNGGGGGGGATAVGFTNNPCNGGAGVDLSSIFGANVGVSGVFAGGGGGSNQAGFPQPVGGVGGGGNGMIYNIDNQSTAGTVNTGGGGGAGGAGGTAKAGGSGVVIFKYPDDLTISNPGGGLTFTTAAPSGGFKITTFTAGTGNVQWS